MWKETWGCQSKWKRTEFPGSWKHYIKKKLFGEDKKKIISLEVDRRRTRRERKRRNWKRKKKKDCNSQGQHERGHWSELQGTDNSSQSWHTRCVLCVLAFATPNRDFENCCDPFKMTSFSSKWAFFFATDSYHVLKLNFGRTLQWMTVKYKQPWETENGQVGKAWCRPSSQASQCPQHFKMSMNPLLLLQ